MALPLWLMPGWAHTAESLRPMATLLARHRPVKIIDPRAWPDRPGYAEPMGHELRREHEPCVLAGWSLGGMIALEAAAACPEKTAALIMISSAVMAAMDGALGGRQRTTGPDHLVGLSSVDRIHFARPKGAAGPAP